jgi:hypothetical protein
MYFIQLCSNYKTLKFQKLKILRHVSVYLAIIK